ncbi:MAG: AAA family ATPase, partial [Chromatocurvus sp.]
SSELRWIDLMSDLAFAVMDLRSRGEPGFAWLLLDEYLAATGDYDGLRLLPLYMVYRALVRAKVTALRLEDADADRKSLLEEVAQYLKLAVEISDEHRPAIMITAGLSGSGKSWLAQQMVERVGLVRVRSDIERKRLHGLRQDDDSGAGIGTDLYSSEATRRTYDHLVHSARSLLDAGMPALIDAACLKHWQRSLFGNLAAERGVPFGILHCQAQDAVLRRRILARETAGNDASEAGVAVLEHQQQSLESLDAAEQTHALDVDTAGHPVATAADWLRARIGPGDSGL